MSRELGSDDVPDALRAAGARVETHNGNFAPDAPDDEWIREVGRRVTSALGSRASRSPSPMMLNARTASTIAPPGKSETHGASARNLSRAPLLVLREDVGAGRDVGLVRDR